MTTLQIYQSIWSLRRPSRTRPRDKPMTVLCLGMPRTGTESIKAALEELGYPTYHGFEPARNPGDCVVWCDLMERKESGRALPLTAKDFDQVLGLVQAVSDTPSICFADELIEAYPDAKIILNHRLNIDAWQDSIASVVEGNKSFIGWFKRVLVLFSPELFWLNQHVNRIDLDGLWNRNIVKNSLTTYKAHYAHLSKVAPPERTLKWSVHDGWAPLCEFLGKPIPNTPFPHKNTRDEQHRVLTETLMPYARKGLLLAAGYGGS
ncbi:conserved hypothetical protein [Talaromyces stipitatus ATCC 10500]|uniref:NAD dependent epimerase/dehydratase n=1 Tax=Talaromyces stipitatus (strain ATCC 10500 / CBS 375.48 / QM 6759 / NRRL 1006) TaxID=441959 RepID=B8LZP9_TALSN|nr:uncharacterized protein TSTA_097210 [Talaromyces stipitatus ATCC 10500]EED22472.1 conserved hypothetical protein [Talaromyces stipitatus ATCC 10500]